MALNDNDIFLVERNRVQYQMTAIQMKAFFRFNYLVETIAERDALTLSAGDKVWVRDASGDATVTSGSAEFIWDGTSFIKMTEAEGLDITVAPTNLGYTPSANNGVVTSTTGTHAVIPAVNATNAGLATPEMLTNSHAPVTAAGTAQTNPITVTGQAVGLSLANLAALP